MAKTKYKKKKGSGSEIIETPDVLAEQISKTEQFIEKNKRIVFSVGGVIALLVAGYFLYKYYVTTQNDQAQSEMFQAVYYFETDSLDRALEGDGNNLGFIQIIEDYPLTKAANLAHYYAGACYLKKGEYFSAIDHLESFSANDLLVQARAYALIGDAMMETEDYEGAAKQYRKAADYKSNEFTSPQYLVKCAVAYEMLKDYESAFDCYDEIVSKYVKAAEYQEARKQRARLKGLMAG